MEQIVLDYSPPVIDHTTALAASHPSVWSSLFVAANVSAPSNSSFCFDGCGWGPFTPDFQMTPCFIDGVLFGALSIFLLVLGVYQLYVLSARHPFPSPLNWHFFTKLGLVSLQIVFYFSVAVLYTFIDGPDWYLDIAFWSPVATGAVLFIGLFLHYQEHFRSTVANGVLLFYWLFSIIFTTLKLYSLTYVKTDKASIVLHTFLLVNSIFIFVLEWLIPKAQSSYESLAESDEERSPIENADIFSLITFSWMSPMMKLGYSTFLTEEDLPQLPKSASTSVASTAFNKHWQQQLSAKKNPSLTVALTKAFGGEFFIGGLFKSLQDILAFTQPQLLRILIKFVKDYSNGDPTAKPAKGFAIAFAMFFVSIVQTAFLHQYFHRVFEVGMKLKSSLTSAIYQKSLVLAGEERGTKTTGDIVNLMSVDTQRLQDLTQYGQTLWSGPFQIILCLVSLHNLLGNSMWAGVVIMLIMIPVNAFVAKYQKNLQSIQMETKDKRTRLTNELLTNIKSLKLYGWEIPFTARLNHVRNDLELKNLRYIGIFMSLINFFWSSTPYFVSCSTFAVYVWTNDKPLTSDIVFPALNLFNLLGFPLAVFPMVISSLVEASVAVTRLTNFFVMEEVQPDAVIRLEKATQMGEDAVIVQDATFLWTRKSSYKVALSNVNFKAKKGELSCIIGKVGAGKSAFLQSLLGDLHKSEGTVTIKGNVAYVAQVPWITNATVRDNILFGNKYDPEFYKKTIEACALTDDFAILPDGDATQVGEKGISLSGGQKARLSLARAVYARADVYLFDDPLSAVDEHVGSHIIENVLGENGLLASKTLILATNSIPVLSHAHRISMISNGQIVESGSYNESIAAKGAIYNLLKEFGKKKAQSSNANDIESSITLVQSRSGSPTIDEIPVAITSETSTGNRRGSTYTLRRASVASFSKPRVHDDEQQRVTEQKKEHVEQGQVKWNVYKEYAKSCNPWAIAVYFFFLIAYSGLGVSSGFWLKHWSDENTRTGSNEHIGLYLGIYFVLCIGSSLSSVLYTLTLWVGCAIYSAKRLHNQMLESVVRAPMSFFETTPMGRILNRFSNDIYKVDAILHRVFSQFFSNSVNVCFTLVVITYNTPPFVILIIPLGGLYVLYQRYYLRTSRELKRLDSVSKSPVYAHFQETLGGISTIRAYHQQSRFNYLNESGVDVNLRAYYPSVSANRWLAVRLEFIGSVIILCASGLSILTINSGHVNAGSIGLAMSYALQITQSLNWIVRMTVEVETNIVSVERIMEYCELPSEAPAIIEDHRPPAHWPSEGRVEFKNYSTRYRPELDLVLKNINLSIKSKEKIGIVGRTGAGKSSLTLALFRIIEAAEGEIDIDDLRTSSIGLADLRHNLSIIPQDSQAFEGTLRENLDPNNEHDDIELWRVLELSHLKVHVQSMEGGLEAKITEGGSNLSVGQRQLLCIARALLTPSRILVLDEATAAVDVETDKIIQETIRSEFKERTILTIAHRLNTIMDSDKIVVLDQGRVAEFASPTELLADSNSMFYALCKRGGFLEDPNEL